MLIPREGERYQDFINRCVEMLITAEGKKPEQARAICESLWKNNKK